MKNPGILIVLAIIMICIAAGCSSSPPSDGAGPTQTTGTGAQPITPTGAATSKPLPGNVKAVHFNALIPFLPNPPGGWTADDPDGATMNTQEGGSWSTASRQYSNAANADLTASVTIVDSAYYAVGGWEMWKSFTTFETTDGYFKSDQVAGFPAWEVYDKPSSYSKWIGIKERFMIYVNIDGGVKADLDMFVNTINYNGISGLS